MPPKPKFTRDEIAAIAYQMIKEGGVSSLTARDLGSRMGTSARPIFTLFKNMEEVKQAARALAVQEFMDHIRDFRDFSPAFKRIGMAIVSYGIHEPELFKLLFLQEHPKGVSFEQSLLDMDGMDETCIQLVMQDYGLSRENATLLFQQMWTNSLPVFQNGALFVGVMCAMGVCDLSEVEIGRRLGIMFTSLMMFVQSGNVQQVIARQEQALAYHGGGSAAGN